MIRSILKIKISQILNIRQQFSLAQFYFWWLQFYLRKSIQKQLASAIKMSFYSWWLFSGDSSFLRALCISDGLQVSKSRGVLTKFPFLILFNSWGLSRMMSHQRIETFGHNNKEFRSSNQIIKTFKYCSTSIKFKRLIPVETKH